LAKNKNFQIFAGKKKIRNPQHRPGKKLRRVGAQNRRFGFANEKMKKQTPWRNFENLKNLEN